MVVMASMMGEEEGEGEGGKGGDSKDDMSALSWSSSDPKSSLSCRPPRSARLSVSLATATEETEGPRKCLFLLQRRSRGKEEEEEEKTPQSLPPSRFSLVLLTLKASEGEDGGETGTDIPSSPPSFPPSPLGIRYTHTPDCSTYDRPTDPPREERESSPPLSHPCHRATQRRGREKRGPLSVKEARVRYFLSEKDEFLLFPSSLPHHPCRNADGREQSYSPKTKKLPNDEKGKSQ